MDEKINGSSGGKQTLSDFMQKYKVGAFFQKYTMIIALVVVTIVFATWKGKEGMILLPSNITGLIAENAYVFVLATGMLMCILTGGNIDLSVGSVVCFTAAVGCVMSLYADERPSALEPGRRKHEGNVRSRRLCR